ncbi:hypothetical protein Ahy_B10g102888 [Arachis hypogaea]|uniref:PB1-like domain-containing protein n=1 Tax=Arachis hypogaea TaxID=3818 RepID=A0A444X2W6_ARAHY|nr:hypothetical protein Ahy_B10g102888 [Arachis hypogaea]
MSGTIFKMSSTLIIFVYHHMGKLKRDKNERLHYVGGQVTEIERVCVDTYNSFLVEGLFMNLGYTSYPECFWLVSGKELSDRLRILRRDVDVAKMCEATEKNENRIELFFEHPVMDNPPIEDDVEVEDDFEVLKEKLRVKLSPKLMDKEANQNQPNVHPNSHELQPRQPPVTSNRKVRKRHLRPPPITETHPSNEKTAINEAAATHDDAGNKAGIEEDTIANVNFDDDLDVPPPSQPKVEVLSARETSGRRKNYPRPSPTGETFVRSARNEAPAIRTCPWKVYCSRKKFSQAFQIKKLVDEHIYARKNKSRVAKKSNNATILSNLVETFKVAVKDQEKHVQVLANESRIEGNLLGFRRGNDGIRTRYNGELLAIIGVQSKSMISQEPTTNTSTSSSQLVDLLFVFAKLVLYVFLEPFSSEMAEL